MSFAVQVPASDEDLPFAGAMFSFFRSFGQMLGVAIGGVIFQNSLKSNINRDLNLSNLGEADKWSKDASAMVVYIKSLPLDSVLRRGFMQSYVDSLRAIWIVMCSLAAFALVLSLCFTKDLSLDREHVTEQGFDYSSMHRRWTTRAKETIKPV